MRTGSPTRRAARLLSWIFSATLMFSAADRRGLAQVPGPMPIPPRPGGTPNPTGVVPSMPATSPSVSPGTAAIAAVGVGGGRIGAAEVTIVGGNIASARERALAEALKQAVDQALGSVVPDARALQPKVVAQVLGRARAYVRRYRTVEEGERGRGVYGVRIEAEVDEMALQRAFDKPIAATNPGAAIAPSSASSYLLVGAGSPEAIAAVGRAFAAFGARVQAPNGDLMEPAKAVSAASRAGIPVVAFVSASVTIDGKIRGPGVESVACVIAVRLMSAGTGLAIADETESVRGFAADVEQARSDCFERAATTVIARAVPVVTGRSASDARNIVVDADIVEPGAVPTLVKQLRGIGSVSAIEIRRIAAGRVELWVRSRLPGAALAATLGRETGGALAINVTEVVGDLVRVRARLRELVPTSSPPGQIPPSPTTAVPNPISRPAE